MMRTFTHVAFAAAFAGVMAVGGTAEARDVKIGALLPMTGDLQAFGEPSANGVRLAIDEINEQGGVLDQDLQLAIGDTQTLAQAGIDSANRLASVENVAGIVGAMSSGVTIPVARSVTRERGIPQISNASTSPVITTLDDNGYLFRSVPSDALQGVVLGDIVYDHDYRSVSIIYINNDYGEGLAEEFTKQFEERGGSVAGSQPYEPGQASYRGELSGLAGGDAEALVLIGYPENGITILRQSLEEGFFDNFIFTDGMKAPEVGQAIGGGFLDGAIGTVPAAQAAPGKEHFEQGYRDAYGELPPQPFIDTAYDATYLLALAMEMAGSTDGEAVRDALHEVATPPGVEIGPGEWAKAKEALANGEDINYEGASGSVDFDENGDVPGTFEHWSFEGEEIVTVEMITPAL